MTKLAWSASLITALFVAHLLGECVCPAIPGGHREAEKPANEAKAEKEQIEHVDKELDDLGLEYGRYLQEVVAALEEDKDFAKKLENVSIDHIKSGAIAQELHFVDHNVRSKLDELKRVEMDRLRKLTKKEHDLKEKENGHVDHANPHTFEVEDLHRLILKATHDLEELDAKRRDEFKKYEMEKEIKYQESLKNMTETDRKAAESKHETEKQKHHDHPRVHHPGSKAQLEQVWEEQDGMPKEEFNPKTFFAMHDINGDGVLDQEEVEALLALEVRKMYDPEHNPEDDPNEMIEEYHRMREHIYKETDKDRDGLISRKEFLDMTARAEFNKDEGWKGIDEQPQYTPEELKQYEYQRQLHLQQQMLAYQQQAMLAQQYGVHPGQMGYPPAGVQYQVHPGQQPQYQVHPGQVQYQQVHPGQGVPPPQHYPPQPGYGHQGQLPSQAGLHPAAAQQQQQHPPQYQAYQQHPAAAAGHPQQQQQQQQFIGQLPPGQQQHPPLPQQGQQVPLAQQQQQPPPPKPAGQAHIPPPQPGHH